MSPTLAVLTAWLLFGGSHLLFSAPPLRVLLSERLGQHRFVVFFALVAAVTLSVLIAAVALYGDDGPPGPGLSAHPAARWALGGIALVGAALAAAGIVNFPRSPMAVLARRWRARNNADRPLALPATVERITRHPFFVGMILLMGAHALLASTLPGAVFFAGFVLLALIGIPMQDRKLRERHGDIYEAYLAGTSAVPFAAPGRSSDSDSGRTRRVLAIAVTAALLLAALHPLWTLGHGAPFVVAVLVGGLFAVAKQLRGKRVQGVS